jgi:hypothetical protein
MASKLFLDYIEAIFEYGNVANVLSMNSDKKVFWAIFDSFSVIGSISFSV